MQEKLGELRQKIDALDDKIARLLDERMAVVRQVGELKTKNNAAIYHPKREGEILARLSESNLENIAPEALRAIYGEIFAASRHLEAAQRVAFLGPAGSFSHQVAAQKFGQTSEYISCQNIEGIFKLVAAKNAKYGIVPIENNSNGIVSESLDFLASYEVKIIAEASLAVHFCLASHEKSLENIQKIYSKDIAFGQCRGFLGHYSLQNAELIPLDSTAKAANLAAAEPQSAAICASIAANIAKVPILFENIQDHENNVTRFFVISDFCPEPSGADKTSICAFINNSDKPGTLARLLNDFNAKNINLVKLESRPLRGGRDFSFWFYIEFEGHIEDQNVRAILEEKKDKLKWLGSYAR